MLIYKYEPEGMFAFFGLFAFLILIFLYFAHFADDITKLADRFSKPKPKKADISEVENSQKLSWDKFVENNPIPSVLFDEKFNISRRNKSFKKLLQNYNLNTESNNIQDSFACNLEDFYQFMRKTDYLNSIIGDAILNDKSRTPFTYFAVPIANQDNATRTFLAQFVDNSENVGLKEKFIQAQKMQAIGQLAGGVAHDFNNLLTAINGFCDLLLIRHAPGDPSFVDVMHIKQNANRAASLVKQLLAFSRKQTMQMEILQIDNVMSELSNLLRRLIGENINLEVNIDLDSWSIKADKSQLEQVLINLAINARDAIISKKGSGGKLEIRSRNVEVRSEADIRFKYKNYTASSDITPGKYALISVTDNGTGIPAENLKKIFEPFYTTKQVGHGTGLGLATVTGIIEQTGGYIFVSSKEGEGTEFLIYLKKQDRPSTDITAHTAPVKEKVKDLTGQGTILLVEDEEAVRIFSVRALKNKGYNVIEAYSGENALEVFESVGGDNIDLIVSDVVMPGISGPEFVEQVQKSYPAMKVVFVSGYGEGAFYEKYGTERKFNFLPKPYSLNQLAERVKDVLAE